MERKRLVWADSLKGILIILVVLGHSIQYTIGDECYNHHLWNIIYSFHMAAFMAVSGFLAYRPGTNPNGGGKLLLKTVVRRFRQLMIPFFIWSFVFLIVRSDISFDIVKNYLLNPGSGLWFLWVLFFINVIYVICSRLAKSLKVPEEIILTGIGLFLVALMVILDVRVFGFQFIAWYFLFYILGYFIHKYDKNIIIKNWVVLSILTVCWIVLSWFWQMHEVPVFLKGIPLPDIIIQYIYRFMTATIAIYLLLAVSPRFLDNKTGWNKPLINLGGISLGIYTVHFITLVFIVKVYQQYFNESLTIGLSFITGLFLTWLFVWLLSKWRITSVWLLGKA